MASPTRESFRAAFLVLSLSRAHVTNHAARLALFRWDVSLVTNFDHLFMESNSANFNEPIGNWTTSQVTDMTACFDESFAFNQDISGWDVSNVRTFYQMFQFANNFNQDISAWDISSGVTFSEMFDIDTSDGSPGGGVQGQGNGMSRANKCAIGTAWRTNTAWYQFRQWERHCPRVLCPGLPAGSYCMTNRYPFNTKQDLQAAIAMWNSGSTRALANTTYGFIDTCVARALSLSLALPSSPIPSFLSTHPVRTARVSMYATGGT